MFDKIYKEMIEDNPIPYLRIEAIQNEVGDYEYLNILEFNKAFEKLYIVEKNLKKRKRKIDPKYEGLKEIWKMVFNKAKENNVYTTEGYIEDLKEHISVKIYNCGENQFYLRLTRVNSQHIKLSNLLKNSPFMACIKDKDGRFIDVNQKYLESLNKTYDEVIGKTNFEVFDESMAENEKKEDEYVLSENKVHIYQCQYPDKLNKEGYFEVIKWPYTNDDGTMILGTISLCIDKTENIKLRKQLEETEKRFLEIANNIKDIIVIRDDKKAHYINSAFEDVYGFKPDELYEDMDKWYEHWDSIEFDEEPKPYEYKETDVSEFKVVKEGKEDKWIWSRFVPILDEDGNLVKKIGILSDITERKKMREELDKMKMDFFANLSHELRTPINLVLSSIQVIYLKMYKLDSEALEYFDKYLNIINQNGHRLLKLVNNLIDTTRLDTGCFDYNPYNDDIVRYVEDICMSVTSFVKTNDLDIIFDTDEEEKIISFDPDNMERIILNLLSNAIKFNKPNGKIEVSINCEEDIKISIKDSGIGIPKDKLESIFERFEQVKTKFKKEREGSGIGLSLVKSLVEMHSGTIRVNSIYGEGSEFIITLPDILLDGENINQIKSEGSMNNINKMRLEFSDIYI